MRNSPHAIVLLLLLTSFIPPRKPNLKKNIVGDWEMVFFMNGGNASISGYRKFKTEDKSYNGFEFKKKGELIFHFQTSFCGNEKIEFGAYPGSWIPISDSTVRVNYIQKEIEHTDTLRLIPDESGFLLRY